MLHACVRIFDVMVTVQNFLELNRALMTKGMFGMAPELNSSNSKQFSCQTDQLQNSMELQNSRAVVHFFLEFWSTSFAALETSVMNLDMELG